MSDYMAAMDKLTAAESVAVSRAAVEYFIECRDKYGYDDERALAEVLQLADENAGPMACANCGQPTKLSAPFCEACAWVPAAEHEMKAPDDEELPL